MTEAFTRTVLQIPDACWHDSTSQPALGCISWERPELRKNSWLSSGLHWEYLATWLQEPPLSHKCTIWIKSNFQELSYSKIVQSHMNRTHQPIFHGRNDSCHPLMARHLGAAGCSRARGQGRHTRPCSLGQPLLQVLLQEGAPRKGSNRGEMGSFSISCINF